MIKEKNESLDYQNKCSIVLFSKLSPNSWSPSDSSVFIQLAHMVNRRCHGVFCALITMEHWVPDLTLCSCQELCGHDPICSLPPSGEVVRAESVPSFSSRSDKMPAGRAPCTRLLSRWWGQDSKPHLPTPLLQGGQERGVTG